MAYVTGYTFENCDFDLTAITLAVLPSKRVKFRIWWRQQAIFLKWVKVLLSCMCCKSALMFQNKVLWREINKVPFIFFHLKCLAQRSVHVMSCALCVFKATLRRLQPCGTQSLTFIGGYFEKAAQQPLRKQSSHKDRLLLRRREESSEGVSVL